MNRRPWHQWLIGILAILWNSIGCVDFVMTQTKNSDYLAGNAFTSEQIEFLYSYPSWHVLIWGLAVWSAMLGAVFVLAKIQWAVPVYTIGIITYVAAMVQQYGFTEFTTLFPETHFQVMSVVIFVLTGAQLYYAWAMTKKTVTQSG